MARTKAVRVTYNLRLTQYTDNTAVIELMRYLGAARQITLDQLGTPEFDYAVGPCVALGELLGVGRTYLAELMKDPLR